MATTFRWILQLHKDVPRAARFYSEGLDFNINVCTLRWAELQSGPLKLALMQSSRCARHSILFNASNTGKIGQESVIGLRPRDGMVSLDGKEYASLLSFTVSDITTSVTKLMALGAELDGPIKYEIHGKVAALRCIDGHMLGLYEPV